MVPTYLNSPPAEARTRKVQRWRRFRRRLASYCYLVFVFSALLSFWLLLSQILFVILNLKNISGAPFFMTFGIMMFRFVNPKQARMNIKKRSSTFLRIENIYYASQFAWLLLAIIGTLFNPVFKQSANLFIIVLPIAAANHLVFLNYRKHLKELEPRLAGLGAREEKLNLSPSGTPLTREFER